MGPVALPTHLPHRIRVLETHPEGAVADKGRSIDCAQNDHRLCLAGWCACRCHRRQPT